MKKIAFISVILLMFVLVGCFDTITPPETSQVSQDSTSQVSISQNNISSEESIDPSEFFPENMSPYQFITNVRDARIFNPPDENTIYYERYYGFKLTNQTKKYIAASSLDLRSIENKGKTGTDVAKESHMVLIGDCVLIAIAVYDMQDGCAYVVKDSTNSSVMPDDRFYTHTNFEKSDESNYGQAIEVPGLTDESGHQMYTLSYGYPVWHYIVKEYNSLPKDYVVTLTEKQYENNEVVSENVILTLTYQDIQEALS